MFQSKVQRAHDFFDVAQPQFGGDWTNRQKICSSVIGDLFAKSCLELTDAVERVSLVFDSARFGRAAQIVISYAARFQNANCLEN